MVFSLAILSPPLSPSLVLKSNSNIGQWDLNERGIERARFVVRIVRLKFIGVEMLGWWPSDSKRGSRFFSLFIALFFGF